MYILIVIISRTCFAEESVKQSYGSHWIKSLDGKMFRDGEEVDAVHLVAAVDALLKFFTRFQSKVVLVGHNVNFCHIFFYF